MRFGGKWVLAVSLLSAGATAQVPTADWEYYAPYRDPMLYLHSLVNYSHDLQWQFDWERRQLADNALRINTGSVTSKELLTDTDININQPLNDKWRFQGSFRRTGLRQWPKVEERLMLGLERSVFDSSAIYLTASTSPRGTPCIGTTGSSTLALGCCLRTSTIKPKPIQAASRNRTR
jgi:hypothetical protein